MKDRSTDKFKKNCNVLELSRESTKKRGHKQAGVNPSQHHEHACTVIVVHVNDVVGLTYMALSRLLVSTLFCAFPAAFDVFWEGA